MRVLILHDEIPELASQDQMDTLVQVQEVGAVLRTSGHLVETLPASMDLMADVEAVRNFRPDAVFNLVESFWGSGRWIYLAPALAERMDIPCCGNSSAALFKTSNKVKAKRLMRESGLPTPDWVEIGEGRLSSEKYIIKSVWEDASIGLDAGAVVEACAIPELTAEINERRRKLGGAWFAETFIPSREFNIALLAHGENPQVLPPAEIQFIGYEPHMPRIVGYDAKWNQDSYEYHNTPRTFDFPAEDQALTDELGSLARRCWKVFGLSGWARVDFRVDEHGRPFILEVNANPCLSRDAGFMAAAERAGLSASEVMDRILRDAVQGDQAILCTEIGNINWRTEAAEGDVEIVKRLCESTNFFNQEEIQVAMELVLERLAKGKASGYEFIFAECADGVIGYTCFGAIAGTLASYDLYWIVVSNHLRGRGLGSALMGETEKHIARSGGQRIYVETSGRDQYRTTRGFYASLGYREEAVIEDFYAPNDPKVILVKVIVPILST